jgi:hypothetical protein
VIVDPYTVAARLASGRGSFGSGAAPIASASNAPHVDEADAAISQKDCKTVERGVATVRTGGKSQLLAHYLAAATWRYASLRRAREFFFHVPYWSRFVMGPLLPHLDFVPQDYQEPKNRAVLPNAHIQTTLE